MLRRLTALALVIAASFAFTSTAQAHRLSGHPKTLQAKLVLAQHQYAHDQQQDYRTHTESVVMWRLFDPHTLWLEDDLAYIGFLKHQIAVEQQKKTAVAPNWLLNAFMCIHRYEGSWQDPNPPYYGGLQMDYGFMRTYGAEYLSQYGTADHWPPSVQIAVATRAYYGYNGHGPRGFSPWPNTTRYCGLI